MTAPTRLPGEEPERGKGKAMMDARSGGVRPGREPRPDRTRSDDELERISRSIRSGRYLTKRKEMIALERFLGVLEEGAPHAWPFRRPPAPPEESVRRRDRRSRSPEP